MTAANVNDGGDGGGDGPTAPPKTVNPYVSIDNPEEPQLCGFGMTFLGVLSGMVNEFQIMPQQMIEALTPPPEVRAAMLRQKAAMLSEMADTLEKGGTDLDGKPKWGSKWKN